MRFRRIGRSKPVQFLVYLLFRAIGMVLSMPPPAWAPTLARALASAVWRVDRRHRIVAEENLRRAGYAGSPERVRRVYRHFSLMVVELLQIPRLLRWRARISDRVRLERTEVLDHVRAKGKGVIVAVSHLGNWEILGIAVAARGGPLHSVARPIDNAYIEKWLLSVRTCTGQGIISKFDARRAVVEVLRRNGILALMADQSAGPDGEFVSFFGRPASTVRSLAILSLKYGVPIVPANCFREGKTLFAAFGDPIDPNAYRGRSDAVRAMTQAFTSELERYVRLHPEQWNWLHRRWKTYGSSAPTTLARSEAAEA